MIDIGIYHMLEKNGHFSYLILQVKIYLRKLTHIFPDCDTNWGIGTNQNDQGYKKVWNWETCHVSLKKVWENLPNIIPKKLEYAEDITCAPFRFSCRFSIELHNCCWQYDCELNTIV